MHYMTYIASGELGGTTCSSSELKSCPIIYKTEKNLLNMDKTSRTVFIGKGTHSQDTLLKNSAKVTTAYPWINCAEVVLACNFLNQVRVSLRPKYLLFFFKIIPAISRLRRRRSKPSK